MLLHWRDCTNDSLQVGMAGYVQRAMGMCKVSRGAFWECYICQSSYFLQLYLGFLILVLGVLLMSIHILCRLLRYTQ